jgi:hypothetical protein
MEACKNAEAVVITTEWKEFREIDWSEVYEHMNKPAFVFDGRLLVDADKLKQIGFKVRRCSVPTLLNTNAMLSRWVRLVGVKSCKHEASIKQGPGTVETDIRIIDCILSFYR